MTAPRTPSRPLAPGYVTITARLEGEKVVSRRLQTISTRAEDMTAVWPFVQQVFHTIVGAAFASEGRTTGEPWPALAESTQKDRARKGFGATGPILRRTDRLMRSLTLAGGEQLFVATRTGMAIGSNVPYFAYHQSRLPRTRLPRRAPVNLTQDDKHELLRPIRLWITGYAPSSGSRGGRGGLR